MHTDMYNFFKQFLLDIKTTGAIAPSSERLALQFINSVNLADAKAVIEFGAGNGILTEKIHQHLPSNAVFFSMEINPYFVHESRKRCPEVPVYHDSAFNFNKYLELNGVRKCDCIISSLPWSFFPPRAQEELLVKINRALSPGGEFVTYSYMHTLLFPNARKFKQSLNRYFDSVRESKLIWENFPPVLLYYVQSNAFAC